MQAPCHRVQHHGWPPSLRSSNLPDHSGIAALDLIVLDLVDRQDNRFAAAMIPPDPFTSYASSNSKRSGALLWRAQEILSRCIAAYICPRHLKSVIR